MAELCSACFSTVWRVGLLLQFAAIAATLAMVFSLALVPVTLVVLAIQPLRRLPGA